MTLKSSLKCQERLSGDHTIITHLINPGELFFGSSHRLNIQQAKPYFYVFYNILSSTPIKPDIKRKCGSLFVFVCVCMCWVCKVFFCLPSTTELYSPLTLLCSPACLYNQVLFWAQIFFQNLHCCHIPAVNTLLLSSSPLLQSLSSRCSVLKRRNNMSANIMRQDVIVK